MELLVPDWTPFVVAPDGGRGASPRGLTTREGLGDRLRAAAFAELQAREAFGWAAERFVDAPPRLRATWRSLAESEDQHLGWLIGRMADLGVDPAAREVSDALWRSLTSCPDARTFSYWMAEAEERGRQAGQRVGDKLQDRDPESAAIFTKIAREEIAHIAVAARFFDPPGGPDRA